MFPKAESPSQSAVMGRHLASLHERVRRVPVVADTEFVLVLSAVAMGRHLAPLHESVRCAHVVADTEFLLLGAVCSNGPTPGSTT